MHVKSIVLRRHATAAFFFHGTNFCDCLPSTVITGLFRCRINSEHDDREIVDREDSEFFL